jgi:quercetin dioxygenase-like cupin family protein
MAELAKSAAGPYLGTLDERDARWFLGQRTWVRATAAQTGGTLGLVEHIMTPGGGSPYHVHHNEDEEFYVIDGEVRFFSDGESSVLGPGGFAFLPREIPHGFRVEGDANARILLMATPGGFEGFVAELSTPEPPDGPPDMAMLMQAAARYSIDILGPLPE